MDSIIAFVSSVLTSIFALVSWSITAHFLPVYRALSKDYTIDNVSVEFPYLFAPFFVETEIGSSLLG
ncbi:hypothetical protein [Sporisorium scitamineum]|uniref:Uncharacterized protein n=1 Tax=Sporisorium scitamineum TaxID=49012 RepID=A0A0F7RSM6_9BASI|nr:hypothetical protein [Sporisorium scitamineum]